MDEPVNPPSTTPGRDNFHPVVHFPRVSQILNSRKDLVVILRDQFRPTVGNGPVLIVSGDSATRAYADRYKHIQGECGKN